jgi:glycosyltransferase involved in cell wall biosynthesis
MNSLNCDKVKILFFINSLSGGGAERVVVEVINNLDRSRFIPGLLLLKKTGPYLQHLNQDVRIFELSGCGGYKNIFKMRKRLLSLLGQFQPTLIHSNLVGPNRIILRSLLGCSEIPPIVVSEHNNLTLTLQSRKNKFRRTLVNCEIRFLYKKAAEIIAVSDGVKQDLIQNHGMAEGRITVIHNPVDISKIQEHITNHHFDLRTTNDSVRHVVAIGRLTKQKGFSDLIKAFSLILKEISVDLTILGEGELRPELEKQIHDLNLKNVIKLPGFVNNPWPLIHAADLFVMSSYWEGFGNVIVEAMACETPVVSTDCNYGPREIITDRINGILFPVGDIEAMSNAMLAILKDEGLGRSMAEEGKKKVVQFESKIVTRKYEQLFEKIIS